MNQNFLSKIKTSREARFAPFDFHVHTLGSADVRIGNRYAKLPQLIRDSLQQLTKEPADFAAYDTEISSQWAPSDYYDLLMSRKRQLFDEGDNQNQMRTAVLALTDHNVYRYTCAIAEIANQRVKEDGLVILPGVELDVEFRPQKHESSVRIHILCIFAPNVQESDIRMAISSALDDGGYQPGGVLSVDSLPRFIGNLRHNATFPAMCIAAHVGSSRGIQREASSALSEGRLMSSLAADIVRLESELANEEGFDQSQLIERLNELKTEAQTKREGIALDVLKIIGECGFDGLQVSAKDDSYHYRRLHRAHPDRGRSMPLISSDAHCIQDIFDCNGMTPFLKLPKNFFKKAGKDVLLSIRDEALRFGETRTTYSRPGHVMTWMAGIQFKRHSETAVDYWPDCPNEFQIPLSRNLNCFIGGRGSGKSALLDAIAFVADANQYKREAEKKGDRSDWYRRAQATLAGWEVKLCWKSETESTYKDVPKKAKFASRFFDANHNHTSVEIRDIDGQQLLGTQAATSEIDFYRIHEIEAMSQPDLLRKLFDNQRAVDFQSLSAEVKEHLSSLATQRQHLINLATEINALTANETSPLRQYGRRKSSYAAINTAEVRSEYQAVDSNNNIRDIFANIVQSWEKRIRQAAPSSDDVEGLKLFFEKVVSRLIESKAEHPEVESLLAFLEDEDFEQGFETRLMASITTMQSLIDEGSNRFAAELKDRDEALIAAKNQLEAKGLPANAKGREVKKVAFEESERDLELYKALIAEVNSLLAQRRETADKLEQACKDITKLRKEVAESITVQLANDLDRRVLIIEADAQPLKDQSQFEKWFVDYGRAKHSKNAEGRFKEEIQHAFSPRRLSRRLLPLEIGENVEFADRETFSPVLETTCDRLKVLELEAEEPGLLADEALELPADIKSGLVVFNQNDQRPDELAIEAILRLDEIVIDDQPIVRLNDRPLDAKSTSRNVDELSPGQRCSAILPILLLTGTCPLVIDQPEDNLDNRLVRQVIVNILGSIKLKRQVIMATHNPNLPVLGDAEQVVVLRAVGKGAAKIEDTGDLNSANVVQYITDIMEGGREAFQYRQSIYSPHWKGGAATE